MCSNCSLRDQLFARRILIDTGVDGLYARSGLFENVIAGIDRTISAFGDDGAEVIRFPPGMSRAQFERSGYLQGFPQLAGTIHSFNGNERDHMALLDRLTRHEDWTDTQTATDVVLTPAACYPLYPIVAGRGALSAAGGLFDVQSYCFRHEPSADPARMQMFRMREFVRLGSAGQVVDFRESWLDRGRAMVERLALPCHVDVANDPFFGRAGKMLANNQRDQGLKFELLVAIENPDRPTACLSFNYHQDHFGSTWGIATETGEAAHSACVGFGMERIALALFKHHGLDVAAWPAGVREALEL